MLGEEKNDKICSTYDVVELFSSPQVTARARQRGLRGGWSLSKTVVDPTTGRNWDLPNPKDVKAAWNLFYQTQPKLLVTFPPYEPDGEFMIELAIDTCLAQAKARRYFAFEYAKLVNCWHLPCMLRLYSVQNAHKRMVVTNSQAIDSFIGIGQPGAQWQTLCDAMIDGLLAECGDELHCEGVLNQFDQHPDMCDPDEICLQGFDDTTGDQICPELIQQAREEELNGFRQMEVYEYVSHEEVLSDPTRTVVGVRWVDHNKGTSVSPEVRSRPVAQEFASKDRRDDLFAATPPLAATRPSFSTGASTDTSTSGFLRKMIRRRRESGWADSRRPCMVLETAIRGGEDDEGSWFQTIADNSMRLFQRDNKRAGCCPCG